MNFVFVGPQGWKYKNVFEEIFSDKALKGRVFFTGYISDEDLAPIYSEAMAFVCLSLYEGFGLPPLEAMQCGVPVIASNTSSLPEVVGDGGIVISPKDQDALCQNLLALYRDTDLRQALSRKAIERAKRFTWERTAGETVKAYKLALGR